MKLLLGRVRRTVRYLLRTSVALTCREENPETPDGVSKSCRSHPETTACSLRIIKGTAAYQTGPASFSHHSRPGASSASPGLQPCTLPPPPPMDVGRCSLKWLNSLKGQTETAALQSTANKQRGPHRRYGPAHTQRAGSPSHTGRKPAPQPRQVNRVSVPTHQ